MRIVIVDDHNLFRQGLETLLQQEKDIEVVGLAGTVSEAVRVVREKKPDIVLMDFSLPDGDGAEACRLILQENLACKVVFMTMSERDEDLVAAVRSGAVGYLLKNMSITKLVAALRAVQQGESALSRTMTLRVMQELARSKAPQPMDQPVLGKLTEREKEVLELLGSDKSNLQIAEQLVISENTVKYHVHSILEKLKFHDRKEAARFAREHGL